MDFLLGLIPGGGLTAIIGAVLAGIAALAALVFGAKKAGRDAERAKQAEADAKARDIADEVENDVGAMTPEQRKEALKKWSR